nr:hypothetical protein GCM10020093_077280 [Planobispora longispora]
MGSPRLVATDLDGTALRSDGTVSPRTAAAFARVENAGATLVFVTGRPPRWMHTVAGAVHHRGWPYAPTAPSCTTCTPSGS